MVTLIYDGWLPQANTLLRERGWIAKRQLKRRAQLTFGRLPPSMRVKCRATVEVVRVLGPRQRMLDVDNLALLTKPILDAVVSGGYLVDDRGKWANVSYRQDETRRDVGPRIEIMISYEEIA